MRKAAGKARASRSHIWAIVMMVVILKITGAAREKAWHSSHGRGVGKEFVARID